MNKRPRLRAYPAVLGRNLKEELDEIMRLLGQVANEWAGIEEQLCTTFMHLTQTDATTAAVIFFTPSSFRGRLQIVQNLLQHCLPDGVTRDALERVLVKLDKLNSTRNNLIHATYGFLVERSRRPLPRTRAFVMRWNVRPRTSELRLGVRAQKGELQAHINALYDIDQFLHFLNSASDSTAALGRWANIVLNTSGATFS